MFRNGPPAHCCARLPALLALILALACQVASGAVLPAQAAAASPRTALAAAIVLCQSGHRPPERKPAPYHAHTDQALVRAIAASAAHHAALTGSVPRLPVPAMDRTGAAGPASARAPPASAIPAAYPRGPPSLV
jgi:hypothetical protein